MNSPNYKLIYFNFRGKAEPLRWMFAYSGISFEDFRINEKPTYSSGPGDTRFQWDALKKDTPFGTLPVLEVDGKYLGETNAIARFLGKKFGLCGENDWQEAQADSIVTYLSDTETAFMTFYREQDVETKKILEDKLLSSIPTLAKTLEKILQANNDGTEGFLVGKSPTFADFLVAGFYDTMERNTPILMKNYEILTNHRNRIHSLPGVKEFIEKYADQP